MNVAIIGLYLTTMDTVSLSESVNSAKMTYYKEPNINELSSSTFLLILLTVDIFIIL